MNIFSKNGFSLVEVLIVSAFMACLSLALLQLIKNHTNSSASMLVKMDEIEMKRNMMLTLQDSISCKNTFQGKTINQEITLIKNNAGNTVFSVGNLFGEGKINITSMKTIDLGSAKDNIRDVNLLVSTSKQVAAKSVLSSFTIKLKVVASGITSPITECYTDSDGLIIGATVESCTSLSGKWDVATKKCTLENYVKKNGDVMTGSLTIDKGELNVVAGKIIVDGDIQISQNNKYCIGEICRDFSAKKCNSGEMIIGIKVDGELDCIPIPAISSSVDCIGVWENCSVICGGGTQKYLILSPPKYGGKECSHANGETRICGDSPCPIQCVGSWSTCNKNCGGGVQSYTITIPAAYGGKECDYKNGQAQICNIDKCICSSKTILPTQTHSSCVLPETLGGNTASCIAKGLSGNCKRMQDVRIVYYKCDINNYRFSSLGECDQKCKSPDQIRQESCSNDGRWSN